MQVKLTGISHVFPGTSDLFHGLSLTLTGGELVALTGPSGSGKSTLLSLLAGWEAPTKGVIAWDGVRTVGWVFQNPFGVPGRSAVDHVALPLLAHGVNRKDATCQAMELLERFGLVALARRDYAMLSGGEAQRLMLARAVAKHADLLLVDEPTAQLDPTASDTVNRVLAQVTDGTMITVVATHNPETAAACGKIIDLIHQPGVLP
ncbi:MAG: ATP-binding cassette domain-containing protein [Propionibacteriaceae bacterium]|nr:ATP-binding cassette domain-containing protein [Propionibacteriaceae bacterium]